MLFVPAGLLSSAVAWWGAEGQAWLDRLPDVIAELERRWAVSVGRAFDPGGCTAFVAPATRDDGSPAVLKIAFPHRETRYEAHALALQGGNGTVRLLASDPARLAMLVERCQPGTPLGDLDESEVMSVATGLLRRFWRPVPRGQPFESLADVAADRAELTERRWARFGRPFDARLVRRGVSLLEELPASAPEPVLLHQDFHPWNILAAEREPWLVVDPKPLVGDPASDTLQLVLHGHPLRLPDPKRSVCGRLHRLAADLGLDADRMRLWGVARMVEWAMWSLDVRNDTEDRAMAEAGLLASL